MSAPKTIAQTCPHCDEVVAAVVFGTHEDRPEWDPPFRYDAAYCPKCDKALLFVDEDYGQGWDGPYRLFPPQPTRLSEAIPESLRADLTEARKCFNAKCFTATSVMVRRMTENLCVEQGVVTGSLFRRLKALKDTGIIEPRLYEWADILRELGNEGAHGGAPVTKADAQEALAMAEALLDYVYSFQQRYNDFKSRIDARRLSAAAKPEDE